MVTYDEKTMKDKVFYQEGILQRALQFLVTDQCRTQVCFGHTGTYFKNFQKLMSFGGGGV